MLTFQRVTKRNIRTLRRYYENCLFGLCEYSAGVKLMWRDALHYRWAEAAGCLIVCARIGDQIVFDYPVALADGDEEAALEAIERECIERGIAPVFAVVPEEKTQRLLARYPYTRVSDFRSWRDYLYYKEDLLLFSGRRYSGQRNHIKKFRALCPNAEFRVLEREDGGAIARFWDEFEAEFPKGSDKRAAAELQLAKRMMEMRGKAGLSAGGMFDGDRLVSLCLVETCGATLVIHVEKALYSCVGAYPATVQAEAETFGEGCRYINREDDAADRGLRTSKLQYGPCKLAPKYRIEPQNELLRHVEAIPELKTERLTLSALTRKDIPAYNALVLDAERNRYWGYDDLGALKEPMTEESFYRVAENDFARRLAVNFAVRLNGKLIGEAVLYNFDYRGGAELGCRVAKEYAGNGYGTEAFAAVAEWGLYRVNLTRVYAKCYRENAASYKMLSSCMRRIGEDETFFYFEKQV
ncbi:MAG: GNAT family N-acetyltransferase [Oscillibacter sp.]|nr:GNAT family N-acetyltransferase [Oscillibacter sp.]